MVATAWAAAVTLLSVYNSQSALHFCPLITDRTMKFTLLLALSALVSSASAGVYGAAEGFAKGVTGGGSATPVYPQTTAELIKYLGDSEPRVIYLTKTFDFTGTEGTVTETGCAPWGTGDKCQTAINANNWCSSSYQKITVKYDKAATVGIYVKSNKSLIGVGNKGVLKGKGLRLSNGVSNIIIQNVKITNLNPQYVWGGDAITLSGTDLVWIDRVTTSLIGRQHLVLGNDANKRVTVTNSFFDGMTTHSPACDTYQYWGLFFTGANDVGIHTLQGCVRPADRRRKSPSRTTTSTTLRAARPSWAAARSCTRSTTTGTTTRATRSRATTARTCLPRATFCRTSRRPSSPDSPATSSPVAPPTPTTSASSTLAARASTTVSARRASSTAKTSRSFPSLPAGASRPRPPRMPPRTSSTPLAMARSERDVCLVWGPLARSSHPPRSFENNSHFSHFPFMLVFMQ